MNLYLNTFDKPQLKWPGTVLAAGATTASILWLMQLLISTEQLTPPEVVEYRNPKVVLEQRDPTPMQRERAVERPQQPEELPKMPELKFDAVKAEVNLTPVQVATVAVDPGAMSYAARGPIPLMIAPAEYPRVALSRGTEGFVELEFNVNAAGMPENIRVVRSEPSGVFDKSAMRALAKSKFSPVMQDGVPISSPSLRHRFIFAMEGQA